MLKILIFSWFLLLPISYAKEKALSLAVFPYSSPAKILQHNKGLKYFLQNELQQPISIVTAKSNKDYVHKLKEGAYDFIFAAPHIARYAELHANYKRVAVTKNKIQAYYIIKKSSSFKSLADLKNKTIAMTSEYAIFHQLALHDFEKHKIFKGKNLKVNIMKNNLNSIFALLKNKADVALTGILLWKKLPDKYKRDLKLLEKSTKTTGFIIMVKKSLAPQLQKITKNSLLKFHTSKEGKSYLFKGYREITDSEMKQLDPYIYVFK